VTPEEAARVAEQYAEEQEAYARKAADEIYNARAALIRGEVPAIGPDDAKLRQRRIDAGLARADGAREVARRLRARGT
jgi:aminoglycoside phosphotransferase family enzyme